MLAGRFFATRQGAWPARARRARCGSTETAAAGHTNPKRKRGTNANACGFGPLAGESRKSADAAGGDESRLAALFWPRPRRDRGRFWRARNAADAPGIARLARPRIHSPRLVAEGDAPA